MSQSHVWERLKITRCPRCNALPRPTLMGRTICPNCGTDVMQPFPHVESADCWCGPTLDYTDPDTGVSVWVHRKAS